MQVQSQENEAISQMHIHMTTSVEGIQPTQTTKDRINKGPNIFTDAAWKTTQNASLSSFAGKMEHTGIGVIIYFREDSKKLYISIQASAQTSLPLQAEAKAMEQAAVVAEKLQIHQPNFFSDNQVLVPATVKNQSTNNHGHWEIKPMLDQFRNFTEDNDARVFKIARA